MPRPPHGGAWARLRLSFSASAVAAGPAALAADIDGVPLPWDALPHADRQFHSVWLDGLGGGGAISPGTHTLTLTLTLNLN